MSELNVIISSKRTAQHGVALAYLLIIFYFPLLRNVTGSSSSSQFLLNVVFLIVGALAIWKIGKFTLNVPSIAVFYFILAIIVLLLSLIYESNLSRIFSDSGRLILSGIFAWYGFIFARESLISHHFLAKFILSYILIAVVFSFLVYDDIFWPIVDLYKGRLSDDDLNFHFLRFSGFSGYPTDFGCLLVLGLLLGYSCLNQNLITKRYFYLFLLACLIGLALSVARGALVQLAGLIFIYTIIFLYRQLLANAHVFLALLFLLFLISWAFVVFDLSSFSLFSSEAEETLSLLPYIFNALTSPDASVLHRYSELYSGWQILIGSLSIPEGIERDEPFSLDVIESAWGHYSIRFGLFGVILYLVLALTLIFSLNKVKWSPIGWALYYWLISFFIFVAPFSDVLSRLRGLALYSIIIGFCLGMIPKYSKTFLVGSLIIGKVPNRISI